MISHLVSDKSDQTLTSSSHNNGDVGVPKQDKSVTSKSVIVSKIDQHYVN